jgi:hypothetical protein
MVTQDTENKSSTKVNINLSHNFYLKNNNNNNYFYLKNENIKLKQKGLVESKAQTLKTCEIHMHACKENIKNAILLTLKSGR